MIYGLHIGLDSAIQRTIVKYNSPMRSILNAFESTIFRLIAISRMYSDTVGTVHKYHDAKNGQN